ncbi:MAG: PVC-type heme-binding CxxCH protein [Gemmataceae bacterium]
MKSIRYVLVLVSFLFAAHAHAQKEHGFDNTKASGQPYLTPEESVKRMKVPDGWEVKVFAAEPDIINPISFTVDEKGRLWVVECYEYPKRTAAGQKPRDRIKILEDTKGTGHADKVTVWAEGKDFPPGDHNNGFDLASGIEVGHGGVFLGAAPYLFFLQDKKGVGKCDSIEVLLKGFGSEDTHEVLNTLQWGPDGLLYGLHGIFTFSKVGGVNMDAAVWRYDVPSKKFEIFAEGTSNPWGMDFDEHGQCFLACCVIPHFFHIIPGGAYIRQDGRQSGSNPYSYGQLKEICDHIHHQESGWAHAGTLVMQGDNIPKEYRGSVLMGSIHGCSVKRDVLSRNGSTYVAKHGPDFLLSGDKNFRPINMRWAPDGSIYLIDWHDQNPCHQAAPDSWDMTHGRIYKIQRKDVKTGPAPDLSKKTSKELVELLKSNNPWTYRTALRLLSERAAAKVTFDRGLLSDVSDLISESSDERLALRGLWALKSISGFVGDFLYQPLMSKNRWIRAWTIRMMSESGNITESMLKTLAERAETEPAPEVRLQLACTARQLTKLDTLPLLHNLMNHKEDAKDPCIPLMLWLAYEPRVAADGHAALRWLKDHAAGNELVLIQIVPRTLRRLAATGKPGDLAACVAFLGEVTDPTVRRAALEALVQALQSEQVDPPEGWKKVLSSLLADKDEEVQRLARRLAIDFRDLEALERALDVAQDRAKSVKDRLDALRDLGSAHPSNALQPLQTLLTSEKNPELLAQTCRTLANYSDPNIAKIVLAGWKNYPAGVRTEAVNLLAGRKEWARDLLVAVGKKEVPRTDLNDNTILRIRALRDKDLNGQIEEVWGRVRDTPAELAGLIHKMRQELYQGRASASRGQKAFENACAKCHKFDGKGHEVGPNLDGAARDIEYLLVNVLDPNRVVGQPYFTRLVELKNGTNATGLLAAEDEKSITLKSENDVLKVILKKDIEQITISEKSVMPEGLDKSMTVQDFRDLVRYVMANPFLTEVAVAGPFPVDKVLAIDPLKPLTTKEANWQWPLVGVPGRIPLPAVKGDGQRVAYLTAEVTAPDAMVTKLQLGAASHLRVWVNAKEVYKGQPSKETSPDQAFVDVHLHQGANQVLIQATYRGDKETVFARFLDPNRKLQYSEGKGK